MPYDPSVALGKLEKDSNSREAWEELWQELHHQGDVGVASYAAIPHLVRIHKEHGTPNLNLYALTSIIEIERHRAGNPSIPSWLQESYDGAWEELVEIAIADLHRTEDPMTLRFALATIATGRGSLKEGALLAMLDESDIEEFLDERLGWSARYS